MLLRTVCVYSTNIPCTLCRCECESWCVLFIGCSVDGRMDVMLITREEKVGKSQPRNENIFRSLHIPLCAELPYYLELYIKSLTVKQKSEWAKCEKCERNIEAAHSNCTNEHTTRKCLFILSKRQQQPRDRKNWHHTHKNTVRTHSLSTFSETTMKV